MNAPVVPGTSGAPGSDGGVIDDIDTHLVEAGSIDRAAGPLGVYIAWCANLNLLSEALHREHEREIVRLRMRDLKPGEFLIRAIAGTLRRAHLNDQGLDFSERYFEHYLDDYAAALDVARDGVYNVEDSWDNYDRVAPVLTREFYRPGRRTRVKGKHWWQRVGTRFGARNDG